MVFFVVEGGGGCLYTGFMALGRIEFKVCRVWKLGSRVQGFYFFGFSGL